MESFYIRNWLREPDLNRRPSGYEPDELPSCSIPRPDVYSNLCSANSLIAVKYSVRQSGANYIDMAEPMQVTITNFGSSVY